MSIRAENVSYIYNEGSAMASTAIHGLSVSIGDGEFIGLIGHTGSGKSTFIQLLNGLLAPSEGRILYNGKDIHGTETDLKSLRTKVGLVFQYPEHQLFESDVLKDVMFGPKNQGLSTEEQKERAVQALQSVGVSEEDFSRSPVELSGGQKRRAAIAGVLAMRPEVLILDEPTAGLDPRGRDEILDLISGMHREMGITVILVSHSMEDVASHVGRILVMDDGNIRFDGTPREVFSHREELEEMGLSAPSITYTMEYLRSLGLPVDTGMITISEAAGEILRCLEERNA